MSEKGRPGASFLLRMTPEERERIRRVVPHGLNAVAVQLLLDYVRDVEAHGLLPLEEDATTAA